MHGLINRAIQCFLRDTYGHDLWDKIMRLADLGYTNFESMLVYEDQVTFQVLDLATTELRKSRAELLEDLGTYLVSHKNVEALRRLLRFAGVDFLEFLHSLDDLPDRARLAVPDLFLPQLELVEHSTAEFSLHCGTEYDGFAHVMVGVLRAMADDYGALVFMDHAGQQGGDEVIAITLLDQDFSAGRSFELAQKVG